MLNNIKNILLIGAFAFLCGSLRAQLNTTHYIPPFFAYELVTATIAEDQALYISTPHVNANYTITDGSGVVLQSGSVQEGNHDTYFENGYNTAFIGEVSDLNVIHQDKGLIITSDSAIYINMRVNTVSHAGSLTSKGIDALGTRYRLGHIPTTNAHSQKASAYSIMATEDGTTVTIDFKRKNVVFLGAGAADPSTPLTINLDAGESYMGAIHTNSTANNLDTGLIGSLVTSNKPIAVLTGSWAGSLLSSTGGDIGIDQIVDASFIGSQYVTVRGQGAAPNDDLSESVLVVADEDNTEIFVNDNPVALANINAGEYYLVEGNHYVGDVLYIETSKDAFVYQFILGLNNTPYTQGMNFVPPISCYSSQEINSIPVVDSIGTIQYAGAVTIVTQKGSNILVNGVAPVAVPQDAVGSNYEAYKIEGLTGNVKVETNTIALVGFFGYSGTAGYGGYFSGFDEFTFSSAVSDDCPPGVLNVSANLTVGYQWYLNDVPIPGETNDSLQFDQEGDYYVVFDRNGCEDTSDAITIFPLPAVNTGDDFAICDNYDTLVTLNPTAGTEITWLGTTTSDSFNISSPGVYWMELNNLNGCFDTDTLVVTELTIDPISFSGCLPDTIITASNDTTGGIFNFWKDGVLQTVNDSLIPTEPGVYHATITTSVCTDSTNFITIHPQPQVDMGSDFIICENYDSTLTLSPPTGITLAWFATDTVDSILVTGPIDLWVELSNDNGCIKYDSLSITELIKDSLIVTDCVPGSITVNSNADGTYRWFRNDTIIDGFTDNVLDFETPGSYTFEITTNVCKDSSEVIPVTKSDFSTDLLSEFQLCKAWDTLINVHHSDEVTIHWMGGTEGDSYLIDDEGEYWIEISDINECLEYDTVLVEYKDCDPLLSMPNVLSLSSSTNGSLTPIFTQNVLDEIDLRVYNRWGMKVAHEVLLHRGWDGTVKGIPVTPGTYFWTIEFQSLDENGIQTHTKNGFVQVIQ